VEAVPICQAQTPVQRKRTPRSLKSSHKRTRKRRRTPIRTCLKPLKTPLWFIWMTFLHWVRIAVKQLESKVRPLIIPAASTTSTSRMTTWATPQTSSLTPRNISKTFTKKRTKVTKLKFQQQAPKPRRQALRLTLVASTEPRSVTMKMTWKRRLLKKKSRPTETIIIRLGEG